MLVVPRVNTPAPMDSLPGLVEAGFSSHGVALTPIQRVNFASLVAIETARGSAIKNNNPGNLSAGTHYEGAVWRPPWFDDVSSPLHAAMLRGEAPSAFRAYSTLEEGARDFARLLLTPLYVPVMQAADQSDADVFRQALSEHYSHDYKNPKATTTLAALQHLLGLPSLLAGGTVGMFVFALSTYLVWRLLRA